MACDAVADDPDSAYHAEREKKICEMTGSGLLVQITNEDLHEIRFKMATYMNELREGKQADQTIIRHMSNGDKVELNFREC